jgi:protein-disulfide isomerase
MTALKPVTLIREVGIPLKIVVKGTQMNEFADLAPPVLAKDHAEGPASARVTLVEYGDYQCAYCGAAYPVIKRLRHALRGKLRFVFRNFPLIQEHPYAGIAAEATEAAALQQTFWEMHDLIYENQEDLEPEVLPAWAKRVGLDLGEFATAMKQEEITKRIRDDRISGIRSGVNATPCFFINGARYGGTADYGSLRSALEEQLDNHV